MDTDMEEFQIPSIDQLVLMASYQINALNLAIMSQSISGKELKTRLYRNRHMVLKENFFQDSTNLEALWYL